MSWLKKTTEDTPGVKLNQSKCTLLSTVNSEVFVSIVLPLGLLAWSIML